MSTDAPSDLLEDVCAERASVDSDMLEQIVTLAVELAREGREGRKVGTIFTVGNAEDVLGRSQPGGVGGDLLDWTGPAAFQERKQSGLRLRPNSVR